MSLIMTLFLQCLNGPKSANAYAKSPESFKDLFLTGRIQQLELMQDFNIEGSYNRCFYKVDGTFYQSSSCNEIVPHFEDDKLVSSGSFINISGNQDIINMLNEKYKIVYTQPFIIVYHPKS